MDTGNKKDLDEEIIEGHFKSSDDPPEFPLAVPSREKIVFVEVEKPVEKVVYRDAPTIEHHHHHTFKRETEPTPYQLMDSSQKRTLWIFLGILALVFLGTMAYYSH